MKTYFYIDHNKQQAGPVSQAQLTELRSRGIITDQTYVWTAGFSCWMPLISVLHDSNDYNFPLPEMDASPTQTIAQSENQENATPRRRKLRVGNVAPSFLSIKRKWAAHKYRHYTISGMYLFVGFIIGYICRDKNYVEINLPLISESTSHENAKAPHKRTGKKGTLTKATKQTTQASQDAREELQRMGIPVADYEKRLCEASQRGNIELVRLLLAAGAHVNTTELDPKGRISTPLSAAVKAGHVECVEILLDAPNIDVNLGNPLYMAVNEKRYELIQRLLKVDGIDVNQKWGGMNYTPLMIAVFNRDERATALILQCQDVDVNATDGMGEAPIHKAVNNHHDACLELLLKHPDINVNQLDGYRHSPMYNARMSGDNRLVKRLKEAGAI